MSLSNFTVFDLGRLCDGDKFRDFLRDHKLLIDFSDFLCECGHNFIFAKDKAYSEGFCWRCASRKCRKKISEKSGSWFSQSKLCYSDVVKLTYFWANNYPNHLCALETSISAHTVIDWYNFCRDICVELLENSESRVIGGPGIVVEIDESKFGKRKYHRGKRVDGVWVFGGIERDNKKNCFFVVVEDRSADTLIPLVERFIAKGSIVISDCWRGYARLGELGYTHETVNHSVNFKDPETGAHTNHIETTWHRLKSVKYRYCKNLISSYFAEFIFRRKFLEEKNSFLNFIKEGINKIYTKERAFEELRKRRAVVPERQPLGEIAPSNGTEATEPPPPKTSKRVPPVPGPSQPSASVSPLQQPSASSATVPIPFAVPVITPIVYDLDGSIFQIPSVPQIITPIVIDSPSDDDFE